MNAKKTNARLRRAVKARTAATAAERIWAPVPDPGTREPIYVPFPAPPDDEALAEAASYVESLEARGQIDREPGEPHPGATHAVEVDPEGRRRLVRKRFAAR